MYTLSPLLVQKVGLVISAIPKSTLYGYKTDFVFSVQEQNKKTGEVSGVTLYYRVQVGYTKDGKLVTQVTTITRDEFLRLTGQKNKKDKKKKKKENQ